jgi:anti-anti-sigma factor
VSDPGESSVVLSQVPAEGCVVVAISGRLDAEGVRAIGDRFDGLTGTGMPVVVDLTGVTSMDSLGVALLVRLAKRLRDSKASVAVIPGAGPVARLLGLARVDRILNVAFTLDAARRAIGVDPPA